MCAYEQFSDTSVAPETAMHSVNRQHGDRKVAGMQLRQLGEPLITSWLYCCGAQHGPVDAGDQGYERYLCCVSC